MIERKTTPQQVETTLFRQEVKPRHQVLTMIEGDRRELDFLQREISIGKLPYIDAAPRFRELIIQNPEWAYIFDRFGNSPKHFVRLLIELYPDRFMAYNHLYRLTTALDVGESQRKARTFVKPTQLISSPDDPRKRLEITEIMVDYEIESRFLNFLSNPQQTLSELETLIEQEENEIFKESYRKARDHFLEISHLSIPAFRPEFQPRPYQSEAILKGLHNKSAQTTGIGIFDEMGTGKTLEALGRVEYLGAQKTLVVAPAGVKRHWQDKIREYYKNPPESVIIETTRKNQSLEKASLPQTKYVIVSYDILTNKRKKNGQNGENNEELSALFKELNSLTFDSLIVDESHYAKNHKDTLRSKAVLQLAFQPSLKHLIFLSGTPVDKVRDMQTIAHILDPETYPTVRSFSEKYQENPRLSHNALLTKIIRRTSEEVLELPNYQEDREPVSLTPTQEAVYNFIIHDENSHPWRKLKNLRAAILHQRLVKGYLLPFDTDQAHIRLNGAYIHWKRLNAQNSNLEFNTDFLVTHGYKDLYLSALFNLKGGISELVDKKSSPLVKGSWKGETTPAKFVKIKELIRERVEKGEKVIVFSSFFTRGVTQKFNDEVTDNNYYEYLLDYLKKEFGEESILKIGAGDGTESKIKLSESDTTSEREVIRRQWQNDLDKKILLTSIRVSSLGIDLTVNDPKVSGVSVIFEGLPFAYGEFKQAVARVLRHGQKAPVTTHILEASGTLDADIYQLLQEKQKLIGMLLDAVPLTEEEEKILEETPDNISGYLAKMVRSPRQNISLIFSHMLGKSADENKRFLSEQFTQSQTYEEYLASWHNEIYENGYAGHNAQAIKQIIEGLVGSGLTSGNRIADWGSGPLILSRTLKHPVLSLDISPAMLLEGKRQLEEEGINVPDDSIKVGSITDMPKDVFEDNSIDIGVCSLALDCTKSGEERVQALKEMSRCIIPNGYLILTIPDNEMGTPEFYSFKEGLKELGFEDSLSLSGYIRGTTNDSAVFNEWIFVAKKVGLPNDDIDDNKFTFLFEKNQDIKKKYDKQLQNLARRRSQKISEVEKFVVCVPDKSKSSDAWAQKGELNELLEDSLLRYFLDLSENELAERGFRKEFVFKNGQQEIHLTRK